MGSSVCIDVTHSHLPRQVSLDGVDFEILESRWLGATKIIALDIEARKDGKPIDKFEVFQQHGQWRAWDTAEGAASPIRSRMAQYVAEHA